MGFPITTIRGFRFVLYPVISMAWGFRPGGGHREGILNRPNPFKGRLEKRKNKSAYLFERFRRSSTSSSQR